ncbi:hypothetical protein [Sediminitomix flava]|uniref:Uncharacterized protein n=1 Tax=Sediminitomix flava TaxID=379075 RepID=A0A315ZI62_SEDFL|nr:hypothetical protein [Sediminitomix flava]PWJ44404.1 hypothetical protein BC781_101763 [Sediminitomix flava]
MTRLTYTILLVLAVLFFTGCEENDPLADQGTVTGDAPTITMDRVKASAAGKEFDLRVRYWGQDDNIESVEINAWILQSYTLTYSITSGEETYAYNKKVDDEALGEKGNIFTKSENFIEDWQTAQSAYITDHAHLILPEYAPVKEEDLSYLSSIESVLINEIANEIVPELSHEFLQSVFVDDLAIYDLETFMTFFEEVVVEESEGDEPPITEWVLTEVGATELVSQSDASVLEVIAKSADGSKFVFTSENEMFFEAKATNTKGISRIYNREISAMIQ